MNADKRRWKIVLLLAAFICVHPRFTSDSAAQTFDKKWLSAQFYSEGASAGDFNNDGKMDVVNGPFIYDGPDFMLKRKFADFGPFDPLVYSTVFFEFTGDFNNDGYTDIMTVGFPGKDATWYENPQGKTGDWKAHLILDVVDNESPVLAKFPGDRFSLVCIHDGQFGYAALDPSDPAKPWKFHPVSNKDPGNQRFTHGLGVGDVNGDGRLDLLERTGWWEQPEKLDGDPLWKKHPFNFADTSAQMYAYDIDGDGDNDVVTCTHAHGYGLAWFDQTKTADGEIHFHKHVILSDKADEKINGVQFSEPHAMAIADMDGDGLADLVTGKRYWAHGPHGDPDAEGRAVLYWFKLVREGDGKTSGAAHFEPKLIDDNSGVGTMITATDINGDQKPDIVVGNKKGQILLLSK